MTPRLPLSVLIVVTLTLTASEALSQDCACKGQTIDHYEGGDGQPLYWLFDVYQIESSAGSDPLLCYFESVSNKSAVEVRDVRWEVANFFRQVIPKNTVHQACPIIRGSKKEDPTNGPLQFGTSSSGYDTTVEPPKNGWQIKEGNATSTGDNKSLPTITATVSFDIESKDGGIKPARLLLTSSAKTDGKSTNLQYVLENASELNYALYVNAWASKTIISKVPFVQKSQKLAPHDKLNYDVQIAGSPELSNAQIVIYNSDNKIVAIDAASIYTGGSESQTKERTDKSFWDEINK